MHDLYQPKLLRPRLNFLLFALLHLASSTVTNETVCYHPNSRIASNDYACFPGTVDGPCCPKGQTCSGGGLCTANNTTPTWNKGDISRGSCTDQTWASDSCPQVCRHDASNAPGLSQPFESHLTTVKVTMCAGRTNAEGTWCCQRAGVDVAPWDCCVGGGAANAFGTFRPPGESLIVARPLDYGKIVEQGRNTTNCSISPTVATSRPNCSPAGSAGTAWPRDAKIVAGSVCGGLLLLLAGALAALTLLWRRHKMDKELVRSYETGGLAGAVQGGSRASYVPSVDVPEYGTILTYQPQVVAAAKGHSIVSHAGELDSA